MTPGERWRKEFRPHSSAVLSVQLFIALAAAFAITTVGIAQRALSDDLVAVAKTIHDGNFTTLGGVHLAAYFYFLVFGLLWGINGYREIHYLQDWLKPPKALPKSRYAVHIMAVCIAILLGLLFALSGHFKSLLAVFSVYSAADIWLWHIRQQEVGTWIKDNEGTLRQDARLLIKKPSLENQRIAQTILVFTKANLVLKKFYVERPHKTRVFFQFVVASALGALWIAGVPDLLSWPSNWVEIAGYIFFLICATGCEYLIHVWRREMDVDLADLDQELGLSTQPYLDGLT